MQDLGPMTSTTSLAATRPPEPVTERPGAFRSSLSARATVALTWLYVLAVALWLLGHDQHPETTWWLSDWATLPIQGIALWRVAVLLIRGHIAGPRRSAWWLVAAFIAGSVIANIVWNFTWAKPRNPAVTLGDALYFLDYLVLSGAFACFIVASGGSLRRPQFWGDMLTIGIAMLAAFWAFLFAPFFDTSAPQALSITTTSAYAVILTLMLAMAALSATQVAGLRRRRTLLLLAVAALFEATWEIAWLAGEFSGRSYVGLFYNFGNLICFALLTTAAATERGVEPAEDSARTLAYNALVFLPALCVLVGVVLAAGSAPTARNWVNWVPVLLVLLLAALVVARQSSMRVAISGLYHLLAVRNSDARLTELARRSSDVIVVMNEHLTLTFVSPTAHSMLGRTAEELTGTGATHMLGPANEAGLEAFLNALLAADAAPLELETTMTTPAGEQRFLQISGTNQLGNRLIAGVALTLRDITTHRRLEREIIDVAARERLRMCSDIHEGLGQELSGIALLLHCAASNPNADARTQQQSLEVIVGHVNRTIEGARRLAEELSPIHIARGSLVTVLNRLAQDLRARHAARVDFTPPTEECVLDANIADHLYRIAKEAAGNALRHSGGTVLTIALCGGARDVTLTVTDNGRGMVLADGASSGLGLRMMNFRARAIGAALRIETAPGGGTRLAITVPLQVGTDRAAIDAGLQAAAGRQTVSAPS